MNENEIPTWAENNKWAFENAGSTLKKYARVENFYPRFYAFRFNPETGQNEYVLWNSRRMLTCTDDEIDFVQEYL